jgi:hypothetical protein
MTIVASHHRLDLCLHRLEYLLAFISVEDVMRFLEFVELFVDALVHDRLGSQRLCELNIR